MSEPSNRNSLRRTLSTTEQNVQALERERNGLLDILNAAVVDAGGALVIREASWVAARRHRLEAEYRPGCVVIRPAMGQGGAAAASTVREERPAMLESAGMETGPADTGPVVRRLLQLVRR